MKGVGACRGEGKHLGTGGLHAFESNVKKKDNKHRNVAAVTKPFTIKVTFITGYIYILTFITVAILMNLYIYMCT